MPSHEANLDDRALQELLERSADSNSDSMRSNADSLAELVETGHEQRSRGELDPEPARRSAEGHALGVRAGLASGGALAASAFGAALVGLTSSAAFADTPADVQMLQTSASLEVLAVSTYKTALTLPYVGGSGANSVVKAFAQTTMDQHSQHLQAFNSAATALGGRAQNDPDPKYVPTVNSAVAAITKDSPAAGLAAVVDLAITLENVAAQTYVNNCSHLSDANAKKITASIMGVESQHVAILMAVKALLGAGDSQLIALDPSVAANLPSAAGEVGFPNSFYPTSMASPATEGALS